MNTLNTHHLLLPLFALATASQVLATERDASPLPRQAPAAFSGRVFFSATERRALETKPAASAIPPPAPAPVPTSPKRRFDGTLWRDGRIVALWFNGNPVDPADEPGIRIGNDIPVTMVSGQRRHLSPGQNWPIQSMKSEP